jgi:hypothetical protein
MYDHGDLAALQAASLRMQGWIRKQTFSPESVKTLRRFSSWEVAELIFRVNQSTFRGKLAADPTLPAGEVEEDGRQRWFSLDEINALRRRLRFNRRSLMPKRPAGKRAVRAAIANFKGGAGKSTVALHFAHAAALDGYRVLAVDFDPQATLSHSMGLTDVAEERTVWGVMARDLVRETERMNAAASGAESGVAVAPRRLPASVRDLGISELRADDFIRPTGWSTIDIIPSCANAAFVEFASAQYRHLNPDWTFFAAVSRYLEAARRRLRPDHLRLPAGHRLPVDERGVRGRCALHPVGARLLGIRLDHQLHRAARRGAGGSGGRVRRHLPRGEGLAAQGVPRRAVPADALRAGQRPAPGDVRRLPQGLGRAGRRAAHRADARGRAVRAFSCPRSTRSITAT